MQAEGDEPQRYDTQEHAAKRLAEQKQERASESLHLARVMVDSRLDDEPADHKEDHPSREHPETPQPDRKRPFGLAHLRPLEVRPEGCPIRLEELAETD